jgi:hypothetical protein
MTGLIEGIRRQWLGASVGTLALFVALGGPALAEPAAQAAARLITGKQIKAGTLSDRHLSSAARARLRGAAGPAGATGALGPAGAQGERGEDGLDGANGADGQDGANGQDGRSFRWRGAWSALITYSVDDVVSFQGASLIATRDDPNPPNAPGPSHWNVMAAKGADGAPGQNGQDGLDATSLWAVVAPEGGLQRHSGVVSVTKDPNPNPGANDPGRYHVVFTRSVANCAYVATIGDPTTGNPPAGEIAVALDSANANAVLVRTYNSALSEPEKRPFHLAVFCP